MDPVCHTLVGATLARAGLGRRSRFATAALVIGANLPDVDGVAYLVGDALLWRRGWTHGVLALAIWPCVLTAALVATARWRPGTPPQAPPVTGRDRPPLDPPALFGLSMLAILTHPTLDFLNNYGLRWLMPFDGRWFYGDALFIVDPWLWLMLGAGWLWSGRLAARGVSAAARPARTALVASTAYVAVMTALAVAAPSIVADRFSSRQVPVVGTPMVSPVFGHVARRYVVADDGRRFHVTGFDWWPSIALDPTTRIIPHDVDHPAIARARREPAIRGFLGWARFPFFTVQPDGDGFLVTADDARYAPPRGTSWAAAQVRVPASGMGRGDPPEAGPPPSSWLATAAAALAGWCQPAAS